MTRGIVRVERERGAVTRDICGTFFKVNMHSKPTERHIGIVHSSRKVFDVSEDAIHLHE